MAGSLAEPALTDFLDSFLAQPLDFRLQDGSSSLEFRHQGSSQMQQPLGTSQANGGPSTSGAEPRHYQPQEFLQAQTFTDVLANVANDWHQPQQEGQHAWGGSFMSAGDWNFDNSFAANALDGLPTRLTSTTDCSSNNSGDVLPVKQEDMTSPVDDHHAAISEGESDPEIPAATKSGNGGKSRETPSGRAEQRRTRKREKDRIEELQAGIQKAQDDKEQLEAQNRELAQQLQKKDEELRRLRAAEDALPGALPAADDDRLAASFEGALKLTVQEGSDVVLTPEQIRSMSQQDLISLWGKYVQRLRELLQAGGHPSNDQQRIVQKIHALQREAMILHIRSAIANLAAVKNLNARGRLDRQPGGSAPPDFWQKVVGSLQLAPSQKGLMTELWQSFQGRISKLMEVRSDIHREMLGTMPDGVFGRSFAVNFLMAHELMDALKYNLRQEHIVLCDLAANFHKILTPLQNASCMVNSWPYWPNMPQIAFLTAKSLHAC